VLLSVPSAVERVKTAVRPFLARHPRLRRALMRIRGIEPPPPAAPVLPTQAPVASSAVTERWDQLASEEFVRDLSRRSWTGIPQIHLNHNFRVTGDRSAYWVNWLRDRYFPGGFAGDTLSLGCGEGHLDRILKDCGFTFRSFTGLDISPKAVERARTLADEKGGLAPATTYATADLNTQTLPEQAYDFIYFFQSLHHIEALEHMLQQCVRALRPNGVLMVNEYVGPSRFQWTERQRTMSDALIMLLPPDLRVDLLKADGTLKTRSVAPTVEDMIIGDPSEAVRSGEIEAVLAAHFDIVDDKPWGGTLNYLVFENIAGNFDAGNPYHQAIAELLIHHENILIDFNVLPSDFKILVAKHRSARGAARH